MAIYCPNCSHSDRVRKSTAIVEQETWTHPYDTGTLYPPGPHFTTSMTQLATNLLANEPQKKVIGCTPGLAQIFLGIIGFFCFVVTYLSVLQSHLGG